MVSDKDWGFEMTEIHDTKECNCEMCKWADGVEKRHEAERRAEESRLQVLNAS
jgi:hypothetical protein